MHTTRELTVSPSMLCARGVPDPVGVCQRGCVPVGITWSWGMVCQRGVCQRRGWYPIMHWGRPPLWTEWQTGVKILPCPKLRLRAVKTTWCCWDQLPFTDFVSKVFFPPSLGYSSENVCFYYVQVCRKTCWKSNWSDDPLNSESKRTVTDPGFPRGRQPLSLGQNSIIC